MTLVVLKLHWTNLAKRDIIFGTYDKLNRFSSETFIFQQRVPPVIIPVYVSSSHHTVANVCNMQVYEISETNLEIRMSHEISLIYNI